MAAVLSSTCELCQEPASHFCNCCTPPTFFCVDCLPRHQTSKEYLQRAAALRSNLALMEQFSHEFSDLLQTCIHYLTEYRRRWVQERERERAKLSVLIEAAVQEATRCLDEGTEPESGLGRVLWSWSVEDLCVFSYSVAPPDLQTLCHSWVSYENTLQSLCDPPEEQYPSILMLKRASVGPQEGLNSPLPSLFAAVFYNQVELYDLQTQQSTQHTLSVNFGGGGSYIQVDTHTLMCLGGQIPMSTAAYALDLPSLTLTSLPPLSTPRYAAGVAKAAHTVYVFGGTDLQSCEKYDRQWLSLGDMQERRWCFTPCTFRTLIYLPCPLVPILETFSPQTETFTVLPVYFPTDMQERYSVSFVTSGELCVLTSGKQMGRWRIESEEEFRLFATERQCNSTQLPLIVDSLVLIAYAGEVTKFSLESYAFR